MMDPTQSLLGMNPVPSLGAGDSSIQLGLGQAPAIAQYTPAKLLEIFDKYKRESFEHRHVFERDWTRDIYYISGRQWITYQSSRRNWVEKRLQRWVPRPVTNLMSENVNAICSTLAAINLSVVARPVGHDTQSVATAEIVDQMAPLIHEEHLMPLIMREADFWLVGTGDVVLQVSWDKDPRFNRVFVAHEQCVACGGVFPPQAIVDAGQRCPQCGSNALQPAMGPDGQPTGEYVSFGRGKTQALSPFEYAFAPNVTRFDELPYLIRLRWRDRHYYEANHPDLVSKINWEKSPSDRSLQLYKSLAMLSDLGTGAGTALSHLGASGSDIGEGITEYELWLKPNNEFPQGFVMRVAGDRSPTLIEAPQEALPGPIPYKDIEGKPIFPFVHAKYEHIGGRLYGRSAIAPVIQKQDQLNQLDSLVQLMVQRTTNPVWVIPENAGIENITGEPGLVIKYNVLAAGGQGKPERMDGQDIPGSLFNYREQILHDVENQMGCLVGETTIPCLDGKTRTMQEMAHEFPNGGVWVYGFDCEQMRVVPSYVEHAWLVGTKPVVRVNFKEGTHVDCTADHPFLTYAGGYVRADELQPDDAIVPLQLHDAPVKGTSKQYLGVTQPMDRRIEKVHRMVMYGLDKLDRTKAQGHLDVHHIDNNGLNNDPNNLMVLTRSAHAKITFSNRTSEQQRDSSGARWKKHDSPEKRRAEVQPMLSAERDYWDALSYEERSARNKSNWAKVPEAERKAFGQRLAQTRRPLTLLERAEKGRKQSEAMKLFWASKTEEERQKAHEWLKNHRVASVVPLNKELEVFDLTTSTQNFGTGAGVFVHNTFDIIKGQKPTGVEAFSALQLLVERSQSRFTSVFQSRGEMYRAWFAIALELERQFGPEQRTRAVVTPNRGYTFQHFQNAQLQGQVTFQIEDGTNMPKTPLGKRAAIEQANQLGLINPQDPDQRYALLSTFGLSDLSPSLDVHVQAALSLQDDFERWVDMQEGPPPLAVKPWFDPQVHWGERIKWLNTDRMRELLVQHPEMEPLITQHLQELQFMLAPPPQIGPDGLPVAPGAPSDAAGGGQALANSNRLSSGTQAVPRGNRQGPQQQGPQ